MRLHLTAWIVAASFVLPVAQSAEKSAKKVTGDWTMWGGGINRNMANETTPIAIDFDPETEKRIVWTTKLGSQSYGNPTIANNRVLVGSNNGGEFIAKYKGDKGCVLCFDEGNGDFLWQLTRDKLPQGRVNDWPEQGICSACAVVGDRVYVVTNRAELMCLDLEGFLDGENDGPITDEENHDRHDADIIWSLDLIEDLSVFPHNLATSSPLVHKDMVYIVTSNGVDEAHLKIPNPNAPCFIAVNRNTGELVWENNFPGNGILHGQWASPAMGEVDGKAQVYFPGGDGWLYAFDAFEHDNGQGKLLWKFDLNPKDAKYELGGRGDRNEIISTPVFMDNSVVVAVGQDPEHGEGVGHIYRIDATKSGDVSPVLVETDAKGNPIKDPATGKIKTKPNPNSAAIWHLGGLSASGDLNFRRTISTVSIADGLVYAADLSGFLHCIDFKTGKRYWEHDMLAAVWGSPMTVDGRVFLGDEDGDLCILQAGKELKVIKDLNFGGSIYSTAVVANGKMYVATRSKLFAIKVVDE